MADDADRVDALVQAMIEAGIAAATGSGPAATGVCLWCGEPLTEGRRWCSAECRDDWERFDGGTCRS